MGPLCGLVSRNVDVWFTIPPLLLPPSIQDAFTAPELPRSFVRLGCRFVQNAGSEYCPSSPPYTPGYTYGLQFTLNSPSNGRPPCTMPGRTTAVRPVSNSYSSGPDQPGWLQPSFQQDCLTPSIQPSCSNRLLQNQSSA